MKYFFSNLTFKNYFKRKINSEYNHWRVKIMENNTRKIMGPWAVHTSGIPQAILSSVYNRKYWVFEQELSN